MTRRLDIVWALLSAILVESLIVAHNLTLHTNDQLQRWDGLNALQAPGLAIGEWVGEKIYIFFDTKPAFAVHSAQAAGFTAQVAVFTIFLLGIFYCARLVGRASSPRGASAPHIGR